MLKISDSPLDSRSTGAWTVQPNSILSDVSEFLQLHAAVAEKQVSPVLKQINLILIPCASMFPGISVENRVSGKHLLTLQCNRKALRIDLLYSQPTKDKGASNRLPYNFVLSPS